MLLSVVFELERVSMQGFQTVSGRQIHAWLLNLVRARDPSFAQELHDGSRHKPFTVAVGSPAGAFDAGVANLTPDDPHLIFRITSLSNRLTILLGESIESLSEIQIGGADFCLRQASPDTYEHILAGASSFEQIWEYAGYRQEFSEVVLRFLTPTAFSFDHGGRSLQNMPGEFPDQYPVERHQDRRNTLFPIARLVFTSLAEKWTKNAPEEFKIKPETQQIFVDLVREEAHAVQTVHPLDYNKFQVKGFVGYCSYSIGRKAPAELRHMLHALASFAFYGGVGLKTTSGMGLTICEEASEQL
jgi:CRISPR-associated endoribonuclease Cas6